MFQFLVYRMFSRPGFIIIVLVGVLSIVAITVSIAAIVACCFLFYKQRRKLSGAQGEKGEIWKGLSKDEAALFEEDAEEEYHGKFADYQYLYLKPDKDMGIEGGYITLEDYQKLTSFFRELDVNFSGLLISTRAEGLGQDMYIRAKKILQIITEMQEVRLDRVCFAGQPNTSDDCKGGDQIEGILVRLKEALQSFLDDYVQNVIKEFEKMGISGVGDGSPLDKRVKYFHEGITRYDNIIRASTDYGWVRPSVDICLEISSYMRDIRAALDYAEKAPECWRTQNETISVWSASSDRSVSKDSAYDKK